MKTKMVEPTACHKNLMEELKLVLAQYAEGMTGEEMLAIASQLVGQLIAAQDRRKYSTESIAHLVNANIESGNQQALNELFGHVNGIPV